MKAHTNKTLPYVTAQPPFMFQIPVVLSRGKSVLSRCIHLSGTWVVKSMPQLFFKSMSFLWLRSKVSNMIVSSRQRHNLRCTESFTRENVMEELKQVQPDEETKRKMLDILKRFHSEEEMSSDDEEGTWLTNSLCFKGSYYWIIPLNPILLVFPWSSFSF